MELLDTVFVDPKVGRVLRHVPGRFGHEVVEMTHHFETHRILCVRFIVCQRIPQSGVGVDSVVFEPQEPCHVVNAGHPARHLLARRADVVGEILRGVLHTVA